jgi:hypothetical protein
MSQLYWWRVIFAAVILLGTVRPALTRDFVITEDVVGCMNASDYSRLLRAAGGATNLNAGRIPEEIVGELNHLMLTGFCTIFQAGEIVTGSIMEPPNASLVKRIPGPNFWVILAK